MLSNNITPTLRLLAKYIFENKEFTIINERAENTKSKIQIIDLNFLCHLSTAL